MKLSQVGAQLYTLRDQMKTPEDTATSLARVREIGYETVQVSGIGPIEVTALKELLDKNDLTCCITHEPTQDIIENPEKVAERMKALDCHQTAPGGSGPYPVDTIAAATDFAHKMNAAGKVLSEHGITLSYHNHSQEFSKVEGKRLMDIYVEEGDPRYFQFELDTYWVQHGGANPEAWCRRLNGRLPVLHIKDFGITYKREQFYAEIGYGNLEWPEIISAAEASGCKWFVVEQDTCPGDPFESLKMSFDYIAANLVENK